MTQFPTCRRFFNAAVRCFSADVPPRLQALMTAADARNLDAVSRFAHELGGIANRLGTVPLADLCQQAETAAADRRPELPALVAAIEQEVARARAALQRVAAPLGRGDRDEPSSSRNVGGR